VANKIVPIALIALVIVLTMALLPPSQVYAASTVINPNKDNILDSDAPDTNHGSSDSIGVGWYGYGPGGESIYYSLIEFLIAWGTTLPSDATITSATLSLYVYNVDTDSAGKTVYAQRLLRTDWTELGSTWNSYKAGFAWTTPGAGSVLTDYTTTDQASATVPFSDGVWLDWDITTQVQWAQTNSKNVALRLAGTDESSVWGVAFFSRSTTHIPKLTIVYTAPMAPMVSTQAVTDITGVSATFRGTVTDDGGLEITDRGFEYGLTQTATWTLHELGSFSEGAYSLSASGLLPGTVYWVRAYATNDEGTNRGIWRTFTTKGLPVVVTIEATYVGTTTVRLNGRLTSDGGEACKVQFEYGYSSGVYAFQTGWLDGYVTGNYFYVDLSGLISDTVYYFRAVAMNTGGVAVGTELSFQTGWELLASTNFTARATSGTQISLSWVKGGGADSTVVQMGVGSYPTGVYDGTSVYYGTGSSTVVSDLTPGTSYYFRAWSESAGGFSAGYVQDMATTLAGSPVVEPSEPTTPTGWFSTPDYTRLQNAPLYAQFNSLWDSYSVPRNTGWVMLNLFLAALAGIAILYASNGVIWLGLVAGGLVLIVMNWALMGPMWSILFIVIIGGTYGFIKSRT